MRALQIDPKNGNPPGWAQVCMYICAWAVVFQVTASILLPLLDRDAQAKPGNVYGQIILTMSSPTLRILGDVVRYVPLLCVYGGAAAIVASNFVMTPPNGKVHDYGVVAVQAPAISATMWCVVSLVVLYFSVFTAIFIAQMVADRRPDSNKVKKAIRVLDAGRRTVMFAPMCCMLFVAARMRALQLARTKDGQIAAGAGPQQWVQESMYVATISIFLQVALAYLVTAFLDSNAGSAQKTQDDDTQRDPGTSDKRSVSPLSAFGVALDIFKYMCMLSMFGGAIAVMVGIMYMTPETLPPYQRAGILQRILG
jgi:hypothetical protein